MGQMSLNIDMENVFNNATKVCNGSMGQRVEVDM